MSDVADTDLKATLARIDRDLAELAKLREESNKFNAEGRKLLAEQMKLIAERQKLDRDRWLAPWLAVVGLIGGLIAIANLLAKSLGL